MLNIVYKTYIKFINLNIVIKNQVDNQRKKCYNYDKKRHFIKDYRQPKKLFWKSISQKNINIVDIERNVTMTERMLLFINFGNVFISISLNISDIEAKEESDIDKSENFNISI